MRKDERGGVDLTPDHPIAMLRERGCPPTAGEASMTQPTTASKFPLAIRRTSWQRRRSEVILGAAAAIACGLLPLLGGCAADLAPSWRGYYLTREESQGPSKAVLTEQLSGPRGYAMFEGETGHVATWDDLLEGVAWADVIFLGEVHDHGEGHAVQTALVEDALDRHPGAAISMEMFERNEQADVDAYLRGEIDVTALVERTKSLGWGAPADESEEDKSKRRELWDRYYQPTVDAAKRHGAPVIAANAPREFVRKARTEGFEALRALPSDQRKLFEIPDALEEGIYRRRFNEVMLRDGESISDPEVRSRIDNGFRSQQVWDTTMGRSVAQAFERVPPATKVIHLVGGFHVDNRGGTVTRLLEARPQSRVLTVQVIPDASRSLRPEDRRRADIVIYAPRAPKEEEASSATASE
jgi:uncharacterized iron-regulated protein